jgi:hypothetical protein
MKGTCKLGLENFCLCSANHRSHDWLCYTDIIELLVLNYPNQLMARSLKSLAVHQYNNAIEKKLSSSKR